MEISAFRLNFLFASFRSGASNGFEKGETPEKHAIRMYVRAQTRV